MGQCYVVLSTGCCMCFCQSVLGRTGSANSQKVTDVYRWYSTGVLQVFNSAALFVCDGEIVSILVMGRLCLFGHDGCHFIPQILKYVLAVQLVHG